MKNVDLKGLYESIYKEGYGAPGHNPGSGEKSVARAKALMDKQGRKGAPGLDAMAAAKKEHEAKRGVKKEEVEIEEGMHREADTGKVVDKAEIGKTYYPNMPKKKSSVALRKEKEMKKEEVELTEEEKKSKKDACYHKVKSRYSVWPSAYASGALVKCRQKGAKNWGNKKEDMEMAFAYLMNEGFCDTEHGALNMLASMSEEWLESIIEQLEEME